MSSSGEEFAAEVARVAAGRARARSIQPLRQLLPFLWPYRWRIGFAALALIVSSSASLFIAPAVGGMIDHGFSAARAAMIGRYFFALLAVVAVLAVATAVRFYF